MRIRLAVGVVAGVVAATALTLSAMHATATAITPNGSWPTYHHDDGHTGFDSSQPAAITATTGWTSLGLDGSVYGEPLVYQGIVYVATLNNTVYALNQTDGSQVWSTHLRAPETTGWSCGNVSPQGILGTPVIDPATGRIYAATLGSDDVYRLEGLNLTTGLEELNTVITTPTPAFDWHIQQERGALAVRNGYVYVPMGGRAGDCGPYHGYIYAVPTNGTVVTHFYQTPGDGAGFGLDQSDARVPGGQMGQWLSRQPTGARRNGRAAVPDSQASGLQPGRRVLRQQQRRQLRFLCVRSPIRLPVVRCE